MGDTVDTLLDTVVTKDRDGKLYTNLYSKPIDTHPYVPFSACHHQKVSGPYSQLLRVKHICADNTEF